MNENADPKREPSPDSPSEEHRTLLVALRAMEALIANLESDTDAGWQRRTASGISAVSEAIREHCSAAEAAHGLLAEVEQHVGHPHSLTKAHAEHHKLQEHVAALSDMLPQCAEAAGLRGPADELARELQKHLELQGDLLYDAATEPETGVGD